MSAPTKERSDARETPNEPRSRGWIERRAKRHTTALTLTTLSTETHVFTVYPVSKALRRMTRKAAA